MKHYFLSKTLWLNTLAFIFFCVQIATKWYVVDPTVQASVLAVLNFFLRFLTTKGVSLSIPNVTPGVDAPSGTSTPVA